MNDYQIKNLERITFNPETMAGQATACYVRPVSLVIDLVANTKPLELKSYRYKKRRSRS